MQRRRKLVLTTSTVITLAGIGVLFSASLWLITEWAARKLASREKFVRSWAPMLLGIPLATLLFPLVYSQVVTAVEFTAPRWLAAGAFAGVVAAAGSKMAHDNVAPFLESLLNRFTK